MGDANAISVDTVWSFIASAVGALSVGAVWAWRHLVVLPKRRKVINEEEQFSGPGTGQFTYLPQLISLSQDIHGRVSRIERTTEMNQDLLRTNREETLLLRQEIHYLGDAIKDLAQRLNSRG